MQPILKLTLPAADLCIVCSDFSASLKFYQDILGFEEILDVKAQYDLIPGVDSYELNLEELQEHIETYKIDIELGKSYFKRKLTPKIRSCEVN